MPKRQPDKLWLVRYITYDGEYEYQEFVFFKSETEEDANKKATDYMRTWWEGGMIEGTDENEGYFLEDGGLCRKVKIDSMREIKTLEDVIAAHGGIARK